MRLARALRRRAVTAAATGFDDDLVAGLKWITFALVNDLCLARFFYHGNLTRLAFLTTLHAPGPILDPIEHRLQVAGTEDQIPLAKAETAAKLSRAGRIFTQTKLDEATGIHRRLQLDRNNPCSAVRQCMKQYRAIVA